MEDDTVINSTLKTVGVLDDKIEEKQKAIEALQFEINIFKDKKSSVLNNFLDSYKILDNKALYDIWRAFCVHKALATKNKEDNKEISEEDAKKYGSLRTKTRQYVLSVIKTSCFTPSVISYFDIKLIDIFQWCFGAGYQFVYSVGGKTIMFTIPLTYCDDKSRGYICDGLFRANYSKDKDGAVWDYIASSYSEKEVREKLSDWIFTNCKQ